MSGQDYFGVKHNDSTTQSMSLRALERGAGPSLSGASSTSASTVHTPSSLGGAVTYNTSGVPSLVTHRSNSSIDSYNSGSIQSDQDYPTSSAASTLHATSTSNISNGIPLPRSRSAMAAFPQANLASPPSTQYRPFIPPSTYARTSSSSSASSPGPSGAAPAPSPGQLGANVANHISLAFARGLNGVNGVVNGSTPVRLPQSASNVANAVWNRLPAGMQQLRNDLAWEHWENNPSGQAYERDESAIPGMHGFGNSTRAAAAARDGNPASANEALAAPPANARSSSLGSVVLGTERLREERPGSSNGAIAASPPSSGRATPVSPRSGGMSRPGMVVQQSEPARPSPMSVSAQLRLDYANQQLERRASAGPVISTVSKGKAPYKAGYQPKGTVRDRTDDFLAIRNGRLRVGRRGSKELDGGSGISLHSLEDERLLRRLDKLIELHFPEKESESRGVLPRSSSISSLASNATGSGSPQRLASSMRRTSDLFGKALKGVSKITGGDDSRGTHIFSRAKMAGLSVVLRVRPADRQMARGCRGYALSNLPCTFQCRDAQTSLPSVRTCRVFPPAQRTSGQWFSHYDAAEWRQRGGFCATPLAAD